MQGNYQYIFKEPHCQLIYAFRDKKSKDREVREPRKTINHLGTKIFKCTKIQTYQQNTTYDIHSDTPTMLHIQCEGLTEKDTQIIHGSTKVDITFKGSACKFCTPNYIFKHAKLSKFILSLITQPNPDY